jgi:hypothetical protein
MKVLFLHFAVFIFLQVNFCLAQKPFVKTYIDKNKILIGEPIQYKVVATFPQLTTSINWFTVPDSMAHFELIEKSKIDSVVKDNLLQMQQTLTITSFDSGQFVTPSFLISTSLNNKVQKLTTNSFAIDIGYAVPDSTNQLRDIKPIIEVEDKEPIWLTVLKIVGFAIGLIALIYLTKKIVSRKRMNSGLKRSSGLSPYNEAMQQLQKIKIYNLGDNTELKKYHLALSTTLKQYISRIQNNNKLSATTSDLLIFCKTKNIEATELASTLRCGDVVKFAKYLPTSEENEQCWQNIKSTIEILEKQKNSGI